MAFRLSHHFLTLISKAVPICHVYPSVGVLSLPKHRALHILNPLKPTSLFSLFKEEPRKVCFTYDLFLNLEGNPPVNHLRCEKLTFNNPTIEFRYKLLMAGGVSVPRVGGPAPALMDAAVS